ncbi:MAG: aspartate aminotransferase family protein [Chloroflexi bacterium]|nr:aspartate aminotransferase family protein [Chloroflexota bacterium]
MKFFKRSVDVQQKAKELMPLGVNSNFRYWGEGITPYVERGKGCYLWDVDGNRYIDYRMAFGPIILGHADERVDQLVHAEIDKGVLFAMTNEMEISVAEMMIAMCPAVEMVRFACSGTEATMHAIRVARAYTGRDVILKFEGAYHGFHDYTLWSTYAPAESYGNINSPIPVAASSGIPSAIRDLVITLPFNNFEVLEKTLRSHGHQIAAIIAEPCLCNCGAIEPQPGFLKFIQDKCEEYGIIFILDEVKTGFRVANGGAHELYNLQPDLVTYAKSLGNGYPIAAFGGRKEVMSVIGHGVAQGGTFNNNRPGVAAAYATLQILQNEPVLKTVAERGARLMRGLQSIFDEAGIPVCMNGYPSMFSFAIGIEKPTDQRSWSRSDKDFYLRLMDESIQRGVMPDHDPREPWFLCQAHTDEIIDETLNIWRDVVKEK